MQLYRNDDDTFCKKTPLRDKVRHGFNSERYITINCRFLKKNEKNSVEA